MFSLAFYLFGVHNVLQLSNFFLEDLEKLRKFSLKLNFKKNLKFII